MSGAAKERFLRLKELLRLGNVAAAEKAVTAALRVTPKDPNILHLAAQVAEQAGDKNRAINHYRRALLAHPHWMEATFNLARLLGVARNKKERQEAIYLLEDLSRHYENMPEIAEALARLTQQEGFLTPSLAHWQKALALKPDNYEGRGQYFFACRQLCVWDEELAPSPLFSPNITVLFFDDPALQQESARLFSTKRFASIHPLPAPPPYAHARKKVGYLSSDFHAHATSWLMAELLSLHDRAHFEVFVYSYGPDDGSDIRARLKKDADHFIDLAAMTPKQCAERIRTDEIDVLVDLKGHTTGGRLDILAYRPTKTQMHWLGFPATTGADFINFYVGDSVTIPQGDEKYFTEKVLRLPHCYQINDRKKVIAPEKPKSFYGLPKNKIILASFNQTYKITPELFDIWCSLLNEEPAAILWLYESNKEAAENLRSHAKARGIDPARLFFASPLPLGEHLARYAHVDLALDTHPVGGHTTTSDALWCGVPVVTMAGKSFVSRVAASVVTAAGLPQLVTPSAKDYKALALGLMRNESERKALKKHLADNRLHLPLFDTPRFVREWEKMLVALDLSL